MKNPLHIPATTALSVALFLVISTVALAQDVQLDWARQLGSAARFTSNSIATDASGNVYTTGYFRGTADFNPGEGIFNLTSADENEYVHDIFISKLDAAGNFVWAKRMGGPDNDEGQSITVDASGNVYTTGHFRGTVDFDPGNGVFNLTSASSYQSDAFISKLDARGNFVWARRLGGEGYDVGTSIAADASGNVYTTGYFMGTSDFNPGEGVFNLTSSSSDIFISKLNAGGNFVWARRLGGANDDHGHSIAVDASGNVYTTGYFTGTADFNPGEEVFNLSIPGNNSTGIFISKLDVGGGFVWAKQMGSDETKISENMGHSLAVDASGYIYTTGHFSNTCDFNPGEGVFNLTSAGWRDVFISKLDLGGNFVWAKQLGSSNFDDYGYTIGVDASGFVYITGSYLGKLDSEGNFIWTNRNTTAGRHSLAVDASRHVYTTGPLLGTIDLDPGEGVFNLTNASGYAEIFIAKLSLVAVVNAYFGDHLGWCGNCERKIFKIADTNGKNQYMTYVFGDASTPGAGKFTVYWNGSQWRGQYTEKISATGGNWIANPTFTANGLTTSPKPPCTGWSQGFSLSGDCITPSVTVQSPSGAPSMNASAIKTTGLVNGKNAYDIPVTGGAESEKVTVQWNATLSRWEMVLVSPSARIAAETVLSYNVGDAGVNPPCGGWSDGYALSGDICSAGPLPVTLLSFSASLTDSKNEVRLNWSTTSENNAWYYGLERSRDAKLFEEIARVSSTGNTREITHYIHTDETPLRGRNYYRLRQVDRDDSFTYSPIVSVLTGAAGAPYPNPARGGVIRVEASRGAALKLTDLSGREIPFITQRIDEALTEIRPAQNLQPGVYVVSVDGTGHRVVVAP